MSTETKDVFFVALYQARQYHSKRNINRAQFDRFVSLKDFSEAYQLQERFPIQSVLRQMKIKPLLKDVHETFYVFVCFQKGFGSIHVAHSEINRNSQETSENIFESLLANDIYRVPKFLI